MQRGSSRALRNPANPDCTKGLEVNLRCTRTGTPDELVPLVRSTIPVNAREAYNSNHDQYTYETEMPKPILGAIPRNMTFAL